MTSSLFQDVTAEALRQLYGYIGGALHIDLLHLVDSVAIVKVHKRHANTILALYAKFNCVTRLRCLLSLACGSRDWTKLWSACTLHTQYQTIRSKLEASLLLSTIQESSVYNQQNPCAFAGPSAQLFFAVIGSRHWLKIDALRAT